MWSPGSMRTNTVRPYKIYQVGADAISARKEKCYTVQAQAQLFYQKRLTENA